MRALLRSSNFLRNIPVPNPITLRIRTPTHEFWGNTEVQFFSLLFWEIKKRKHHFWRISLKLRGSHLLFSPFWLALVYFNITVGLLKENLKFSQNDLKSWTLDQMTGEEVPAVLVKNRLGGPGHEAPGSFQLPIVYVYQMPLFQRPLIRF